MRRSPAAGPRGNDDSGGDPFTHVWRVRTRLAERFGTPCRVLARGGMNSILVEFADGVRVVTSRFYVRRRTPM